MTSFILESISIQSLFQCNKLVLFTFTLPWSSVPSIQRASSQFPAHNNSMKNDWRVLTGSSSGFTFPDTLRPSAAQQEDKLEGCPNLHSAKECKKRMPKVWEFHVSYFYKEFQTCDKQRSNRMCVFLSVCVWVCVCCEGGLGMLFHTDTVILGVLYVFLYLSFPTTENLQGIPNLLLHRWRHLAWAFWKIFHILPLKSFVLEPLSYWLYPEQFFASTIY